MKSGKAVYLNLGRQLYTELGGKAQTELIEAAYLNAATLCADYFAFLEKHLATNAGDKPLLQLFC